MPGNSREEVFSLRKMFLINGDDPKTESSPSLEVSGIGSVCALCVLKRGASNVVGVNIFVL